MSSALPGLGQDPELVGDFVVESREHLSTIEERLLTLEHEPANADAINAIFRGFHTIKGLAGFLEFASIRDLAHEVENLLGLARDNQLAITPAVVDVILEGADYLKSEIDGVEPVIRGGTPQPSTPNADLIAKVRSFALKNTQNAPEIAPKTGESAAKIDPPKAFSIRVDTTKLDYLMDMVGEMVIAQSLIRHDLTAASVSQLTRITGEVQRIAMALRMIPVGQLFARTARLVRDLSRKAGKRVELETSGDDTELDKTIAEGLADPLLHMVRNAVDHGIETPAEREAAGKNPEAKVRLGAYHQGGQIVVEVSDDGRGLNRQKILAKAIRNGLVAEGDHLSDGEVWNLIFEPGLSTAAEITDVSGRGVGMDVVRKHVQKLRGRIDIQSKAGQGTQFLIRLPLTLAIIDGLVIGVGEQRYILPIYAVREVFRPAAEALSTVQGNDEMALVRDRLLPIVRLHRKFGVKPRSEDPCEGLLVVTESETKRFCLLVDELVGKQEVVIKSLGETLKNVAGIAGGAILGDGKVGLIVDIDGLVQ